MKAFNANGEPCKDGEKVTRFVLDTPPIDFFQDNPDRQPVYLEGEVFAVHFAFKPLAPEQIRQIAEYFGFHDPTDLFDAFASQFSPPDSSD